MEETNDSSLSSLYRAGCPSSVSALPAVTTNALIVILALWRHAKKKNIMAKVTGKCELYLLKLKAFSVLYYKAVLTVSQSERGGGTQVKGGN